MLKSLKEYGGYLPLELGMSGEFYNTNEYYTVYKLNSARSAIVLALLFMKAKEIYIPYYNCDVVKNTLEYYGIRTKFYYLDENLLPVLEEYNGGVVLVVNYFGCFSREDISDTISKYEKVIIDNTQAFFCEPFIQSNVFNVYSCRKYFGVSDGGYLISHDSFDCELYKRDVSWKRASYLFRSLDEGTNASYLDCLDAEGDIGCDIKFMSILTRKILASVEYERIKEKRLYNYNCMNSMLGKFNEIGNLLHEPTLMVYPFMISKEIRARLIDNNVYVPQWWKYLLNIVPKSSLEYKFSKYLLPLPIDHRYSQDDIKTIASIVIQS